MNNWLSLEKEQQIELFEQAGAKTGLPPFAIEKDEELFRAICTHREVFTPIKGVNYEELQLSDLSIIPTGDFLNSYKDDYQEMKENMFYGESPEFEELITTIKTIL